MANPKVSAEEIRAKRLAKETKESQIAQGGQQANEAQIQSQTDLEGLQGGQLIEGVAGAQQTNGSLPQATPMQPIPPVTPTPTPTPTSLPNLDDLLANASPEQLARIRALAVAKGLAPDAALSRKMPDGSMTISVALEAPVVEQLELWAEADGCSLVEEAQKRITESLENYLYGDWSMPENTVPAPVTTGTGADK